MNNKFRWIKTFFSNIFYVGDDLIGYRHKIVIFGFKFNIVKSKYRKIRKENAYWEYKKNNVDITTLPPATGKLRELQLANFKLLKEFDTICKQNNLHYWIDFGTLIGAVRHKGFIPWDDDVDVSMFRDDYNRILEVVNNNSHNSDVYAEYRYTFLRIKHRKCNLLFLDIFPVDTYGEIIPVEQQLKETRRIKKIGRRVRKKPSQLTKEELAQTRLDIIEAIKNEVVTNKLPKDITKTQYVWGIDFGHGWKNWFTNYDVYFPFKQIEFEGELFPCLNNTHEYLTKIYGDYMSYPDKLRLGHNGYKNFSTKDKNFITEFIQDVGLENERS